MTEVTHQAIMDRLKAEIGKGRGEQAPCIDQDDGETDKGGLMGIKLKVNCSNPNS